jgi:hypothetical protein
MKSGRHARQPVHRHARARARGTRRGRLLVPLAVVLVAGAALLLFSHRHRDETARTALSSAPTSSKSSVQPSLVPSQAESPSGRPSASASSATAPSPTAAGSSAGPGGPKPPPPVPVSSSAATWVFAEVGARAPGTAVLTAFPGRPRQHRVRSSGGRCPIARGDVIVPFSIYFHNTGAHAQTFALAVSRLGPRADGTTLLAQVPSGRRLRCYGRSARDAMFTVTAAQLPPSGHRRATGFFLLIHSDRAKTSPPLVTITVPERVSAGGSTVRSILTGGPGAVRLPRRAALRLPMAPTLRDG